MRQTLRHQAVKIRPSLRVLLASLLVLSVFPSFAHADSYNTPQRREAAKEQFDRAEKERSALEDLSEASRSLKDYSSVVSSYKRVYLITPHSTDVPVALNQVAELYTSMGNLFDEKYYQSAIDTYQFLLREYPTSRYREDAQLAIAQIEQEDLHDDALARKSYNQFLALHPRSAHAEQVRAILDKMDASAQAKALPRSTKVSKTKRGTAGISPAAAVLADQATPATDTGPQTGTDTGPDTGQDASSGASKTDNSVAEVSRIRTWNADTYTRIVINVGAKVKYRTARISDPDRIYFDIEGAKMNSVLLHKTIDVQSGGFLKQVRVAQNQSDVVRVVLDVNHVKDYSVFLLPDPYRLVVDIYGSSAAAEETAKATSPAPGPKTEPRPATEKQQARKTVAQALPKTSEKPASKTAASRSGKSTTARNSVDAKSNIADDEDASTSKSSSKTGTLSAEATAPETPEVKQPETRRPPAKKPSRTKKTAHEDAEDIGPPPIPELTRDGQHSLTRALGLKVSRIVIDPGHGGHDTGTIGPTGLMEKNLCLDVSLRLGKLIHQRLPGADVIFTRTTDTFVPLERRTQIANQAHADLFLSVHANSSPDRQARGIETYYLNFTNSSDAMEVAARENALSDNSVYDLKDLVTKIAKNEKVEESRDLAGIIQESLTKRIERVHHGERDRGVRKAPFVVLIGAHMPSVLAEISFISNPTDEKWLKKPANRERIAEGLYRGIEQYLQSTNSLAKNQIQPAPGSGSGIVARSGNSQ